MSLEEYRLANKNGLSITAINYGAILSSVRIPDRNGAIEEVSLGFDKPEDYLGDHPYFGATVGRVANRIAEGRFTLEGRVYKLACNRGEDHLHGGTKGFDKVFWKAEERANGVVFSYVSPDGEEGYPGTVSVKAGYSLNDLNELIIEYEAETDRSTPVNLANHVYWNLAGHACGNAFGTILDHEMIMHCGRYLPVDERLIPTGEIRDVAESPMDFRSPSRIGSRIHQVAGGYDHCYVVDPSEEKLAPVLTVSSPESGRCLELFTTQPGVQFYTGNFLDGIRGRGGAIYGRHAGFCTETQGFPDSVNHPHFPTTILEPDEKYRQTTVYRFSVRPS
jgi:aldose 1-epimerase